MGTGCSGMTYSKCNPELPAKVIAERASIHAPWISDHAGFKTLHVDRQQPGCPPGLLALVSFISLRRSLQKDYWTTMAGTLFLTSLTALLAVANADGMYTKNSPVLQVDSKSYDRLIAKSNHTSVSLTAL